MLCLFCYHSGSVIVLGSNPNADYNTAVKYPTEYRVERLYPSYYNSRRPQPQGVPSSLSYGGPPFNITLSSDDLSNDVSNIKNASVVVIRTGYSTHTLNMGQRMLVLESSYTGNSDGSGGGVLHVSQVPPNAAILVPGPALFFVVVNGVPSVASQVMIGSGKIETQQMQAVGALPESTILQPSPTGDQAGSKTGGKTTPDSQAKSSALSVLGVARNGLLDALVAVMMSSVMVVFTSVL